MASRLGRKKKTQRRLGAGGGKELTKRDCNATATYFPSLFSCSRTEHAAMAGGKLQLCNSVVRS